MHPTAARVQERLRERGLDVEVRVLPDSTRTAAEAAAAVGCEVGQIVKSLVFLRDETVSRDAPAKPARPSLPGSVEPTPAVMVLCAGDRRVGAERLGLRAASADEARAATGFAIGGVPPLGHDRELETLVDGSLRRFETVWCAAGTPHAVFEVATEALIGAIPGASVTDVD
ncbi:MAG TPA: YbaK/EbsC family protein [Gaiellaceae bacterium]